MVLKAVRKEGWRLDHVSGSQRQLKGGLSGSSPLRLDGSRDGQAGWLDRVTGGHRTQNLAKLKGNYHVRVHSDQIFLMVVRWEAGQGDRQPKCSNESQKLTLERQGAYLKIGIVTA
jgi:hypothetical protein